VKDEALAAFDRIVGLDLATSPWTGRCTRPPTAARAPARTPLIEPSWAGSGPSPPNGTASRSAGRSTAPTATTSRSWNPPSTPSATGLLADIDTVHLDRGYDSGAVRHRLESFGITEFEIQRRGTKVPGVKKQPVRLGLRWVVEATNTWWSNYGQLRRNTDRRTRHRHAALCLATTVLIIGKLLAYRDRWDAR
jgi:hypothetical protein